MLIFPSTIERKARRDKGVRRRPVAQPRMLAARRIARYGIYQILQVTDLRRGRLELRYVRGWPDALTVQLSMFSDTP